MVSEEILSRIAPEPNTGCWIWTGSTLVSGYGRIKKAGKGLRAHRYVYEQVVGKIADGLTIDHLCKNKLCVNPIHLEPVDIRTNILRSDGPAAKNHKKTHCKRGHPFVKLVMDGKRRCCGECKRISKEKIRRMNGAKSRGPYKSRVNWSEMPPITAPMR